MKNDVVPSVFDSFVDTMFSLHTRRSSCIVSGFLRDYSRVTSQYQPPSGKSISLIVRVVRPQPFSYDPLHFLPVTQEYIS